MQPITATLHYMVEYTTLATLKSSSATYIYIVPQYHNKDEDGKQPGKDCLCLIPSSSMLPWQAGALCSSDQENYG